MQAFLVEQTASGFFCSVVLGVTNVSLDCDLGPCLSQLTQLLRGSNPLGFEVPDFRNAIVYLCNFLIGEYVWGPNSTSGFLKSVLAFCTP